MADPRASEDLDRYTSAAKQQLRASLRLVRKALPVARWQARSQVICERLLLHPAMAELRGAALFWPMAERREVDVRPIDTELRRRGIPVCYPFMERCADGSQLTGFRWVHQVSELVERGRGFAEPPPEAPVALRGEVSVVIVPALGVSMAGDRLGYGAGFYDATLPDLCPPAKSVVVAFDFQRLIEVPTQAHDFRCDYVVTDAAD